MNTKFKLIKYEDLDKHFKCPEIISPFYKKDIKIPRKLKKKLKIWINKYYPYWKNTMNNSTLLWFSLEYFNPNYKRFLIKKVCENNEYKI